MTAISLDPRKALLEAPMSLFQKVSVGIVVCLCMLDGFNVFAVTFAAPAIKAAWGVNQAQLGLVLSSGLAGMAVGSLLLAPAADLIGRRRLICTSLVMMLLGSLRSAFTDSVSQLVVSWVFTGLGIGAMMAVIASLAAEYASSRSRDFCLSVMGMGFPLGGFLGGLTAAFLMPLYGWQAIFISSSVLSLIMLAVTMLMLPEPIAPMIARPRPDTLDRVNAYLSRCGLPYVGELPPPPPAAKRFTLRVMFARDQAASTILLTAIYFLHVITLFFVQSWLPSLIASEGFTPARAALIGLWVNAGGIAGALLLGATSMRLGLKRLVIGAMLLGAAVTALFGLLPANFLLLMLGSAGMGFFLQGAMIGLYAITARTFAAHIRASGMGLVIGIGRLGSSLGPAIAGQIMVWGVGREVVAAIMAVPAFAAALMLMRFHVRSPDLP